MLLKHKCAGCGLPLGIKNYDSEHVYGQSFIKTLHEQAGYVSLFDPSMRVFARIN